MLLGTLVACAPNPRRLPPPISHCDVLSDVLKENGLECLQIPGLVQAGVYGPRRHPNENTLEVGFGGELPRGIVGNKSLGGTISRSYSTTKSVKANVAISLSQFQNWLPDLTVTSDRNDVVQVNVTLGELSSVPIQNLRENIREILQSGNQDKRTNTVRSMLATLCDPSTIVSSMALTATPSVKITTLSHASLTTNAGSRNTAGFSVDDNKAAGGTVSVASKQPIVFAVELRESEPIVRELCRAPQVTTLIVTPCDPDRYYFHIEHVDGKIFEGHGNSCNAYCRQNPVCSEQFSDGKYRFNLCKVNQHCAVGTDDGVCTARLARREEYAQCAGAPLIKYSEP